MPTVGKKKFPYTAKGKADAKKAAYKFAEKMESPAMKKAELKAVKKTTKKKGK